MDRDRGDDHVGREDEGIDDAHGYALASASSQIPLRGTQVSVSGTLTGPRQTEKLVEVDGFDIEVTLSDHMAVFRYDDRPGIVGTVGRILGEAEVNIAGMQVSRDRKGGHALVAMTVDGAIPQTVLDEIVAEIGAATARQVDLTDS